MRGMIKLQSIHLQRGSKFLLEGANLTVNPGQKLGLIGANGSGKSSLFKLLLGELHEDAGQLQVPKHWQVAHMAQELAESERTALDYVMDGDPQLRALQQQMEKAEGDALAELYEQYQIIDGYTAEARGQKLLKGLGFKREDIDKPTHTFSGGWRIRLNLAQALMCRSDLLLLDEPTNHLDLDATLWLESWLQNYPGTLLIISHDRDFLDNVVKGIAHLEQQVLTYYSGNYSDFELQRAERLSQQSQAFDKQQQRIAEIDSFVRRFRAKATKAKQAQSRLKELERMERIAPAHVDSQFTFRFPTPEKLPQTLINLDDYAIGYGQQAIVQNIQLSLLGGARIGLLGHNGAGKTTLIKTLAGAQAALSGDRSDSAHLKIGYYAQHQLESLDFAASAALHIQRISPKATEQEIRSYLGSFGFRGERVFEEIEHFSGGEKARLALAILTWQKPNLLLLDEPTNHLDLEVRHALTMALQTYEGAMVLVSHDRHLLKNTVDSFYLVDDGKLQDFDGDLKDYEHWLAQKGDIDESVVRSANKGDKKEKRQQAAARREKIKPLQAEIKKLEKTIHKCQKALAEFETQLADAGLYEPDRKSELEKLTLGQTKAQAELSLLEEQWLEKNERLEAASAGAVE